MTVIAMSRREIDRMHVLRDLAAGRITANEAAQLMRLTRRHDAARRVTSETGRVVASLSGTYRVPAHALVYVAHCIQTNLLFKR